MKKAIVIGCPGGGKSTFARKLHSKTSLSLYHLDNLYWNADKTTVPKTVFLEKVQNILHSDEWIIDGNYGGSMEMRLAKCDTVFFLDFPTEVCLDGLASRRGKPRTDMPWVEDDTVDEEFVSFVKQYNEESRPKVLELLKKYSDKNIVVFKTRKEADNFINSI